MNTFPSQTIPENKKDKEWAIQHFDYAENLLKNSNGIREKYTRLYNAYNGTQDPNSVAYLTKQYGKRNRTKYISYRIGRTKIDLLTNEFLIRPLQATVYTINSSAKSEKLDKYEMILGAAHSKEAIQKLNEVGVDPLEGMDIPDPNNQDVWNNLTLKDKYETLMQTILDHQIPALKVKQKLSINFQDLEITGMCYGKVYVDHNGDEQYMRIDPRNGIFEEIENDTFLEKSPIMGHLEEMPIHNILLSFNLTREDVQKLEEIKSKPDDYINNSSQYFYRNGNVCANVIFLEWRSVEPIIYKKSPKTKKQLEFDSSTDTITMQLDAKKYYDTIDYHNKMVEKGEYQIEITYKEVMYEGVRIGKDIIPYFRKKQYSIVREDKPYNVFCFSYVGALFNTVNGQRVPLMQIIENFSNIFDITMFQILKDLNKAKGKILQFNAAALPRGKSIKDIMYDAFNDSFVVIDSTGQGNKSGRDIDLSSIIKEHDIGLSSSFASLIALKQEILNTIDRLTGINENREGQIAASSTASNAQQSIQASRTITEGLFYLMALFTENMLVRLVETTKLTWGLTKQGKAEIILGSSMFSFMKVSKEIAYQDYAIHLTDGGRELSLRQRLGGFAESALNAKDIRYKDLVKFELAPTLSEANKVLEKAFAEVDAIRQRDMKMQAQADMQRQQQALDMQLQISREDREDKQLHELDKINVKADADIRVNSAKEQDGMIRDQNKFEQEGFNNQQNNFA